MIGDFNTTLLDSDRSSPALSGSLHHDHGLVDVMEAGCLLEARFVGDKFTGFREGTRNRLDRVLVNFY